MKIYNEVQVTKDYTVEVMIDSIEFNRKPEGYDLKDINNRIKNGLTVLTIKQLGDEVTKGKTFMPAKLTEKDGVLRRSINNWHSQQLVALDFDKDITLETALNDEFIRSNAVFLYTTFSHSEELNKFRVVFVLDKVLTKYKDFQCVMAYLLSKFPQADKSCKDGSRLFYGGREVYWFDEKNRLDSMYCINESLEWDKQNNLSMSHPPLALPRKKNTQDFNTNKRSTSNYELISNKNVQGLKQVLIIEPTTLKQSEIVDYIKQLNLPEYLGISNYQSFNDIFHDEQRPSASIFVVSSGTNHWLYKCFSSSSPFLGSIIEVTAKIQHSSKDEAIAFLCNVYGITNINTIAIEQHKQQFNKYIEYLASDRLKADYPNLYKLLTRGKSLGALVQLLSYVSDNVSDANCIRTVAFHKVETFAKKLSISKSSMGRKINLFTILGFMKKLDNSEVEEVLLEKLEQKKREKNYIYRSSVYEFPILNTEQLSDMENFAKDFLENGLSIKTVTYEGIYRSFGKEEAERCFPQDKGKVISELSSEILIEMHRVALEVIEVKGWITKKEIINSIKVNCRNQKTLKEDVLKKGIKEMLDIYARDNNIN